MKLHKCLTQFESEPSVKLSFGLKKLCHKVKPSKRNAAKPAVRKVLSTKNKTGKCIET
jgi:hypothetical protein